MAEWTGRAIRVLRTVHELHPFCLEAEELEVALLPRILNLHLPSHRSTTAKMNSPMVNVNSSELRLTEEISLCYVCHDFLHRFTEIGKPILNVSSKVQ